MADAAPRARIDTLNPVAHEFRVTARRLRPWRNVRCYPVASWDLLPNLVPGVLFDLVFVDGDHKQFARDLPWWDRVKVGGLFVCHDDNDWQSPHVKAGLDALAAKLGRQRDVEVRDTDRVGRGLSGFYRREGDPDWTG
jgi:hypothetical protein